MEDFATLTRERVRRELTLHMRRQGLTPWEIATRVAKVAQDAPSARPNMPDPTHRTIEGLLDGRRSHANTVRLVRNYLVGEAGRDPIVLDVNSHLVGAARAGMVALSGRQVVRSSLLRYCGVYTVGNPFGSQYGFGIIIDLEPTYSVLMVRAVVRGGMHAEPEFLDGYAIPSPYQLTIILKSPYSSARYTIVVAHESQGFPMEEDLRFPIRPAMTLAAEVAVPRFGDGAYNGSAYTPTMWRSRDGVDYNLYKIGSKHDLHADVFVDGVMLNIPGTYMYGYYPNQEGERPEGPRWNRY